MVNIAIENTLAAFNYLSLKINDLIFYYPKYDLLAYLAMILILLSLEINMSIEDIKYKKVSINKLAIFMTATFLLEVTYVIIHCNCTTKALYFLVPFFICYLLIFIIDILYNKVTYNKERNSKSKIINEGDLIIYTQIATFLCAFVLWNFNTQKANIASIRIFSLYYLAIPVAIILLTLLILYYCLIRLNIIRKEESKCNKIPLIPAISLFSVYIWSIISIL